MCFKKNTRKKIKFRLDFFLSLNLKKNKPTKKTKKCLNEGEREERKMDITSSQNLKECSKCKEFKDKDEFKYRGKKRGEANTCMDCRPKKTYCKCGKRKDKCRECPGLETAKKRCWERMINSSNKSDKDLIKKGKIKPYRDLIGEEMKRPRDHEDFIDEDTLEKRSKEQEDRCYYDIRGECKRTLRENEEVLPLLNYTSKVYDDVSCATIERINNNIGHTKSNCVLACRRCNNSLGGRTS